jgi:uncharacterized protein YigA (DUF484 family)
MKPEDIATFLKEHPQFFVEHPDLLASIYVPHPHGAHAIPLAERQVLTLRERSRALEGKLRELVHFGEENDAIGEQMHRLALAILGARSLPDAVKTVKVYLTEDLGVPAVALRLWGRGLSGEMPEFEPVGEEGRVFAGSLAKPYFSDRAMFDSAGWFGEAAQSLRSFAYVPLRTEQPLGLLVLASPDAARFTPDMGTLYLTRLGEIVSVAAKRYAQV